MKDLKEYIKEGLFDDLEEIEKIGGMESNIKLLKKEIKKWIKENYDCTRLEISDKPNENGLYEVNARNATVKNKNTISLTNGMFEWKEIQASFNCSGCYKLESLRGAPKKVGNDFICVHCKSLKTLEGAPKEVGGDFHYYYCKTVFTTNDVIKVSDVKGKIYC